LPAAVRIGLLGGWATLGAIVALSGIVVPLCRRIDSTALAAVIEEKYPELGERLTSSVELAANPDAYHGSHNLIALLLQETEVRTSPLDFLRTVSPRRPLQIAAVAAVVLLLSGAGAVALGDDFGRLAGRFFAPWNIPPVVVPYAVEVQS